MHHGHQREQLEEQMRVVLEDNAQLISGNLRAAASQRAYLAELQSAIVAHRHGNSMPIAPSATDPRNLPWYDTPNLGPFEAAKADGSVALLSPDRIRIYDRVVYQHNLLGADVDEYRSAIRALRAFGARFDPLPDTEGSAFTVPHVDLASLSTAELVEYQALTGTAIEAVRQISLRLVRLNATSRAILSGVRDEGELIDAVDKALNDDAMRQQPVHKKGPRL